jgi:cell division protein FtsN
MAPQREVHFAPVPEVRPEPVREVHIARPPAEKISKRQVTAPASDGHDSESAAPAPEKAQPSPAATATPAPAPFVMPKPWPPRVVHGAAGRLVQIGAFGSVGQAKHGWWYMVRAYPAMAHLPSVVRPDRNSKGRVFYRFRVGTTSQAHSEVLCQRMQKIGFSCAVVGLPWKAKVER